MDPLTDPNRQLKLRDRLVHLAAATPVTCAATGSLADVIITPVEVCDQHGTGVLIRLIFGGSPGVITVRSRNNYGGYQRFGDCRFLLAYGDQSRPDVFSKVLSTFRGIEVRRLVCIPYYPDDVRTAIALKDIFAAPLCTYVMDDQNIEVEGIPDSLLSELLAKSDLRLAISSELREAYQKKFGLRFWLLPPVAATHLIQSSHTVPVRDAIMRRHGVIVGNIWSAHWLQQLRDIVDDSEIELDWYSNAGLLWQKLSAEELTAAGIHLRAGLPEERLTPILRQSPYVVVPTGTLGAGDSHRFISRFSLPSKIPYVLATSNTPILVLGHPDTAAARFVTSNGIGLSAPYERKRFQGAVAEITDSASQLRMRARAAEMAPTFSSEGVRDWIWRSMEARTAVDDRWERLASRDTPEDPAETP